MVNFRLFWPIMADGIPLASNWLDWLCWLGNTEWPVAFRPRWAELARVAGWLMIGPLGGFLIKQYLTRVS